MADIKDLNSYTFPNGQKLIDLEREKYDLFFTKGHSSISIVKGYSTEEEARMLEDSFKKVEQNYENYKKNSSQENKEQLFKSYIDYDVYTRFIVANHTKPNFVEIIKNQTGEYIYDKNVINYPEGYDDWLKKKNQELEKQIQQQNLKKQEREDFQTTIAVNSITKDIIIEPYSRKPEDIEAMKTFVANVSGINAENITNEQSQAFIDNLGTTEEAYLTAKADGTFEYTNNNTYSPDFYKTSEPKEILSIIEDNANHHIIRSAPESEARKNCIKDYEFIHSINEKLNVIEELENENQKGEKFMEGNINKTLLNEEAYGNNTSNIEFENKNFAYKFVDFPGTSKIEAHKELHLMSVNPDNGGLTTIAQLPYTQNYFDNLKPEEIQAEVTKQLGIAKKNIDPEIGKKYFDYSNKKSVEFDNTTFDFEIVNFEGDPRSKYDINKPHKELRLSKNGDCFAILPYAQNYFDNLKPEEIQAEVTMQLEIAKKNIAPEIGKNYFDYSNTKEEFNKSETIKKLKAELEKERATHYSNCDITVPQRDSKGNLKKDSQGNTLTTTLHCSEGTYGALSKLSSKVVDLTFENKQLREQLNQEKSRNAKSQSDNSWSD